MLYFASGALDLPGAMFTASHNPARYNGIKLCRAGAAPIGQDTGLADDPRGRRAGRPGAGGRRRGRHRRAARPARRLRRLPARAGRPVDHPAAAGRRRRGQRDGRLHRARGARRRCRCDVVPLYFELDGTFPNHEANPLDPANLVDLQKRGRRRGCRHRAGLRRRRRPLLRRRRARRAGEPERDHRAGRRPRAGQGARQRRHPQPDHLARGSGDRRRARRDARCAPASATRSSSRRWPRPARCSVASTPRTTTSATSGAPTPACWPPCTCWPRSASRTAPLSALMADYDRYAASGEINSTVADARGKIAADQGALRGAGRR